MPRRDVSGPVGFCASLLVHGALALLATHNFLGAIDFAHPRERRLFQANEPAAPVWVAEEQVIPAPMGFGDSVGGGDAINSFNFEKIQQAREAPHAQAWLSRDPQGPGKLAEDPSRTTATPGTGGDGRPRMVASAFAPMSPPAPFGVAEGAPAVQPRVRVAAPKPVAPAAAMEVIAINETLATTRPVEIAETPATRPVEIAKEEEAAKPTTRPVQIAREEDELKKPTTQPVQIAKGAESVSQPLRAVSGVGGTVGVPKPPADPAPQSEMESDAFSRVGSVQFRPGGVQAKLGREVKTVKPRLPLKGEVDLVSLQNPSMLLRVSIDPTGKVTDVGVLKSSGSNEVDLPTRLAVYQWWIEPLKNKEGKAVSDAIILKISWR